MKLLIVVFGDQKNTIIPHFGFIFLRSFLRFFLQPPIYLPPLCSEGAGWRIDGRAESLDDITPPLRQPVSQAQYERVSGFDCLPYRHTLYLHVSYPTPKFGYDMHSSSFFLVCYPMQLPMMPPLFFFRPASWTRVVQVRLLRDVRLVIVRRLFEAGVLDSPGVGGFVIIIIGWWRFLLRIGIQIVSCGSEYRIVLGIVAYRWVAIFVFANVFLSP